MKKKINIGLIILILTICGCAKPLAEGTLQSTEPVSRVFSADANALYYAIKWALDQNGYPLGSEDLYSGVVESKWVPTGAGSHYVDIFDGKDYGANNVYYKLIAKIVPLATGKCKVEVRTDVKSLANSVKSSGEKEMALLDKIAEHARGYDISVTNLGAEAK